MTQTPTNAPTKGLTLQMDRLFSLPYSCTNRGENNEIKTTTFGGFLRGRLSGQALKRGAREMQHEYLTENHKGIRATNLVPTIKRIWAEMGAAIPLTPTQELILKSNLTAIGTAGEAKGKMEKNALVFASLKEIREIARLLRENPQDLAALCTAQTFKLADKLKALGEEKGTKVPKIKILTSDEKEHKGNIPCDYDDPETLEKIWDSLTASGSFSLKETEAEIKALSSKSDAVTQRDSAAKKIIEVFTSHNFGPDIAISGRMNAGNHNANVDSTCMYSHAISIGIHDVEEDYFTAKDESEEKDDNGAAIIGRNEGSSHTYYAFVNLDINALWKTLKPQGFTKEEFIGLVTEFLECSILSLPKARQSTMFGRTLPHYSRITLKPDARVFSRAEAFVKPVYGSETGVVSEAIARLKAHDNVEKAYGTFNYILNETIEGGEGSLFDIKGKLAAELTALID